MRTREIILVTTAVALVAGCTSSEQGDPLPFGTASPSLSEGRNNTRSDLQFVGHNAHYLLAVNCIDTPKAHFSAAIPGPVPSEGTGRALTVGDTPDHRVDPLSSSHMQRANFLAGITLRLLPNGAVEFNRSDDAPNNTTTLVGPGDAEYIPVPGTHYEAVIGVDGGIGGNPGDVSLSCAPTPEMNPVPSPSPTHSAVSQ